MTHRSTQNHRFRKKWFYGGKMPPHRNKYRIRCSICKKVIKGDDSRFYISDRVICERCMSKRRW